jgi:transposase
MGKFFVMADLKQAPLATEAVRRIDAIFAIERDIKVRPVDDRRATRQRYVAPLVADLEARLSRHADTAKAIPSGPCSPKLRSGALGVTPGP